MDSLTPSTFVEEDLKHRELRYILRKLSKILKVEIRVFVYLNLCKKEKISGQIY